MAKDPAVTDPQAQASPPEEQEPKKVPVEVKLEDAGPARKRLTVTVPAERITGERQERLERLQDEATVPGFRRGNAPPRLIERRFGTAVRDELRGQLLTEAYQEAVEQQKLQVVGQPDIKDADKIELPQEGSLTFQAEVEVVPEVQLPALEGIAVTKTPVRVGEEEVNAELERLRRQFGQMKQVHEGKAEEGDYILADVRVLEGHDAADTAAELAHHPGTYILVPGKTREHKGHVIGIVVEDLGKQLTRQNIGQTLRLNVDGPTSHEDERIKGKPITLVIRLDRIERVEPAGDDQVASQLGVDAAKLQEHVRETLQGRHERQQRAEMHQQLEKHLLAQVKMDLPEGLSGRQSARVLHRQAMELAYLGMDEEHIKQRVAELRGSSDEEARKQLKLFFILNEAAKKLEVEVSDAEVNGRVALLAAQQGRRPEKLRQQMQQSGELEHLYVQIREQKTLDKILEKATVTEQEAAPATPAKKPRKKKTGADKGTDEGSKA